MGRHKQYQDKKHAADAKRKAEKRAKDKDLCLAKLTSEQIISQILLKLANDVTFKVERKIKNKEMMQTKRAIMKTNKTKTLSSKVIPYVLNKIVSEVPKISQKNARKKTNAQYQRLKKAAETTEQRTKRLEKEAKAQALKRSNEDEFDRQARLIRESNCQLARYEADYENPDLPDEYFENRLAKDRERQQKRRDAWTKEERQAFNSKKNDFQKHKRLNESNEDRETRLQIDRDGHWLKRRADSKVVSNFGARVEKAKKDSMPAFALPFVMPEYLNETEEKIVEDYLDRRDADTERRRKLKNAMSDDQLQAFLDKNAKWHRDRRATESEKRITKWIDYYEMRAKNADPKDRLFWIAEAEKEKQNHQNLRAPDSRALLSQKLSTIGFTDSNAIANNSMMEGKISEM